MDPLNNTTSTQYTIPSSGASSTSSSGSPKKSESPEKLHSDSYTSDDGTKYKFSIFNDGSEDISSERGKQGTNDFSSTMYHREKGGKITSIFKNGEKADRSPNSEDYNDMDTDRNLLAQHLPNVSTTKVWQI